MAALDQVTMAQANGNKAPTAHLFKFAVVYMVALNWVTINCIRGNEFHKKKLPKKKRPSIQLCKHLVEKIMKTKDYIQKED